MNQLGTILTALSSRNVDIGLWGEQWLAKHLEMRGYKLSINHKWRRGDLQIFLGNRQSLYIEVKVARQTTDNCYRFRLIKHDRYGGTDHRRTDFVVLLCVTKRGTVTPFVIPTSHIKHQTNIAISGNARAYSGKYAQYRQRIDSLRLEVIQ